ncbi:hypothetical protein G6F56_006244 [Rhizopus delemar]|nr:hypothetical protein G6F56_006244 [Rhizopus delemar]
MVDGLSIKEYRRAAIRCLHCVAANSAKKPEKEDADTTPVYNHSIGLDTLIPAAGLLLDTASETRTEFASMLTYYLEETSEDEIGLNPYPKHTLSQQGDLNLANTLHLTLLNWIQLPNLEISDLLSIKKLLQAMTHRFGADETIRAVPLIFEIQSLAQQETIGSPCRQRAIAALVVEWLLIVADFYRVNSLIDYAQELKKERQGTGEYSAVFVQEDFNTTELEALEPDNQNTVHRFVERATVVEMLSKDGPLRDQDDPEGTELGNKLNTEWDASTMDEHNSTFRIRTSRNLSDLKAKLVTSWSSGKEPIVCEPEKKQTINVENLKEALVGQMEVSGLDVMNPLSKKSDDTFKDMSSLLQSISSGNNDSSPSTLFNPPYKP